MMQLTNLYNAFDKLVDRFSVYKVETIGDGYMIAAGEAEQIESQSRRLHQAMGCAAHHHLSCMCASPSMLMMSIWHHAAP